ncbi:hypothetical protein [Pseudomonas viridiflava]|uniref:hypothetical protein n=1 Tax=Pseudomonas viridiflava TaxID=33069 RepID=UPI00197C6FCE|nr:hypothetical protein [Pseudomonas viridiflava]QXG28013.1 hypothetical protein KTT59_13365 [Pseudomonas viridiflava]
MNGETDFHQWGSRKVGLFLNNDSGAIMDMTADGVYCNTLVAVFHAAFRLGFDPYALAVQAKLDVASYLEMPPMLLFESAERVIDESLLVAKLINERWPNSGSNHPNDEQQHGRGLHTGDDRSNRDNDADWIGGRPVSG